MSGVTSRFGEPDPQVLLAWTDHMKRHVEQQPLPGKLHWMRFYYFQNDGAVLANEALLDNEPWPTMVSAQEQFDWPENGEALSCRWFVVMQDADAPAD